MYGGQSTYIPLKVNQAGVIPIIFASSVLLLPVLLSQVLPAEGWGERRAALGQRQPRQHAEPRSTCCSRPADRRIRLLLQGDRLRSGPSRPTRSASRVASSPASGPGRRPSATWPGSVNRITLPGALFVAVDRRHAWSCSFWVIRRGAASLRRVVVLIAVGVALETMKQIDSQLMMRNYEGFLSKK